MFWRKIKGIWTKSVKKERRFGLGISVLLLILVMILIYVMCRETPDKAADLEKDSSAGKTDKQVEKEQEEQWDKGYDLPIQQSVREDAQEDCLEAMDMISGLYRQVEKEENSDVVLSAEVLGNMQQELGKKGCPVITSDEYCNMLHYEKMDQFLKSCAEGEKGSIVMYDLSGSGGVGRKEFTFDGSDMYVLSAAGSWNLSGDAAVSYVSCTRIDQWEYTEKGWFGYELCVPEPPEVTEIMDGNEMVRVLPLSEACREMSRKYVYPLCYKGNNLLRSNWNEENLEVIDYSGVYEYFYGMKYGRQVDPAVCTNGIPAEEFESVIMEYLPVTQEQLREWAVFDGETQTYGWTGLGYNNSDLSDFGASVPEVVDIRENEDGTMVLTVDAVCESNRCVDALITHELTIKVEEDGSFQYLGNQVLGDGLERIPEYPYRLGSQT